MDICKADMGFWNDAAFNLGLMLGENDLMWV